MSHYKNSRLFLEMINRYRSVVFMDMFQALYVGESWRSLKSHQMILGLHIPLFSHGKSSFRSSIGACFAADFFKGPSVACAFPPSIQQYNIFPSLLLCRTLLEVNCANELRAEAGGSPEANCNLIVWIWRMLILYCVLQCLLPSLESVPSVKVSMSARINSEFVRAEK